VRVEEVVEWVVMIRWYAVSEREVTQALSVLLLVVQCLSMQPSVRCRDVCPLSVEALGSDSPHVPISVPDYRFIDSSAASPSIQSRPRQLTRTVTGQKSKSLLGRVP